MRPLGPASTAMGSGLPAAIGVDRGQRNADAHGLELKRGVADQIFELPFRAAAPPDLDLALLARHQHDFPHEGMRR